MIDRTYAGIRCSTRFPLRTVKGNLPRGSQGTVQYTMNNLDRHLILVNWDTGFSVPVFPNEIDLRSESTVPLC